MGSTFSDFLGQLPAVIFVPFCVSALLLVIVMALIVRARTRRSAAVPPAAAPASLKLKRKHSAPADTSYEPDLPDLEMLIGTPVATSAPPSAAPAAAPPRPVQPGAQPVTLGDGSTVQAVEVLRVLRDVGSGGLVVQMGDRAYRTLADSGDFRADFLQIMRELSPLVRGETPAAAPAADDAPAATLGELLAVREPKPDYPLPPTDSSGEMPGDLPRLDQSIALPPKSGLFRRKKADAPPIPDLNIAGAIEAYVQHKLQFTPDLAGRSIHIHPAPGGGVLIETDGTFYETVDAVDDDDVRHFLSTAIAEWQQRLR